MQKISVTIENFSCPSWNDMRNVKHWSVRYKKIQSVENLVYGYLLAQFARKKVKTMKKVRMTIEAHYKNNNIHDPDNLFVKPIIDTIKKYGIIEDDHGDVVTALTLSAKRKQEKDQVTITIEEIK